MKHALQTISWEIRESIGFMALNRPPENKMNSLFFSELKTLTTEIIPTVMPSAIIIYGSGRHFSSGADISDLLNSLGHCKDGLPAFFEENTRSFLFFEQLDVPVIAAIRGICLGSALELAMFCHFRICSDNALMALPETSFNLMPGCGGTQHLPALAGRNAALQFMLEGRTFKAEEALATGIADAVVPKKQLMAAATNFAGSISEGFRKELKGHYLKKWCAGSTLSK